MCRHAPCPLRRPCANCGLHQLAPECCCAAARPTQLLCWAGRSLQKGVQRMLVRRGCGARQPKPGHGARRRACRVQRAISAPASVRLFCSQRPRQAACLCGGGGMRNWCNECTAIPLPRGVTSHPQRNRQPLSHLRGKPELAALSRTGIGAQLSCPTQSVIGVKRATKASKVRTLPSRPCRCTSHRRRPRPSQCRRHEPHYACLQGGADGVCNAG